MKHAFRPAQRSSVLLLALLALAGRAAGAAPLRQESPGPKAAIGQVVPDFAFRDFLAGGDGRQKLAEFRGQPVLIVNWTDTDFGRGAADEVEKLAKELVPEGLVVILLDTHNKPAPEIEASVMRLYPGSPARLQQNQTLPIEYLANGPPPNIALIGVDGTLLVAGSYTADFNKASKLIKPELKRAKSGWGEHDAARAARALAYGEGNLAGAKAAIAAALAAEPKASELADVRAEIGARFDARVRAVHALLEQGQVQRSMEEARALAQATKGDADWEGQTTALLKEFESEAVARELELDRKLTALLAPLAKKAPDKEPEKLRKFAQEASSTRVGKRALHLAEIGALAAKK